MAILKHLDSKNKNYYNAVEYLTMQYDEILDRPILDENGWLQERENYAIAYFNSSGDKDEIENWEADCHATNIKYNKNRETDEVKSHHYILAFEKTDGLTTLEVQALAEEYALKYFPGHQILVAAHDDNHAHIIINSVRDKERDKQNWMMRNKQGKIHKWEYGAGYKHQAGDHFLNYLRRETMQFCQERGLGQIDLFQNKGEKRTDKEYFAEKKAAENGKITYKSYIRKVISQAKQQCTSTEEFHQLLAENNILCEKRGQFYRYKAAEAQRWIRETTLGDAYKMEVITKAINENALQEHRFKRALKQAQREEEAYVEAWRNKKGIHYTVSLYDDDGRKRGVLEQLLLLTVVMVTGEVQEWMMPQWQRTLFDRKIAEIEAAIGIVKEREINSYGQFLRLRYGEDDAVRRQLAPLQPLIKSILDTGEFKKSVELELGLREAHHEDIETNLQVRRL